MKTHTTKILLWIFIILLISVVSLIDLTGVVKSWWVNQDKHFHLAIFALFMVLTQLLFKNLSLFKISLITFALGLLIELLQAYFTQDNRQFDAYDVLFNLLGIALGLLLLLVYRGRVMRDE